MRAWLRRVGAALKRYWYWALGSALIAGWALWRVFYRAKPSGTDTAPTATVGPSEVAEAADQQITEMRAEVAAQLATVERAEAQVQKEEQDAHEQIRAGGGDAVDELLYGRKVDGG